MNIKECYKVLEIEETNSLKEIKEGYRDIVFVWHPDRLESNQRIKKKAEKKLKQINLAYEKLKEHFSSKTPELIEITISPSVIEIEYHKSVTFTVFGIDSEGNKIEVEQIQWESTGGTIYQNGLYFADDDTGEYQVKAKVGNLESCAKVKIINNSIVVTTEKDKSNDSNKTKSTTEKNSSYNNFNKQQTSFIFNDNTFSFGILGNFIKWIIWLYLYWMILTDDSIYDEPTPFVARLMTVFVSTWIVAFISPNLVINFGLNNQDSNEKFSGRALVCGLYSFLTAIFAGFYWAMVESTQTENFNGLQNWLVGVSGFTMIFTFIYPKGTFLYIIEAYDRTKNRFSNGCGCFLLGFILIGIIGLFQSMF